MIGRILHIARREWLEQRRQPAMLAIMAALYTMVVALVLCALGALNYLAADPARHDIVRMLLGPEGDPATALPALAGSAVGIFSFLVFTQFLGMASVLCGHAVLHDRQCGTLTFLLLAPVRRIELLTGKVLGAIGWAWALYLVIDGLGALAACVFPISAAHAAWLPLSPGWWIAFLFGGPAWAVFIGAICAVISAFAGDVRTAQQGVWFVVFFATLTSGLLLTWALPAGVGAQLGALALAVAGAASTLFIGAQLLAGDVGR